MPMLKNYEIKLCNTYLKNKCYKVKSYRRYYLPNLKYTENVCISAYICPYMCARAIRIYSAIMARSGKVLITGINSHNSRRAENSRLFQTR